MVQALAEALLIIEVRTKIQLLTLEAEGIQVLRFPIRDTQTIRKPIKGVEDDSRSPRCFNQFGQSASIGPDAVGAEIEPHGFHSPIEGPLTQAYDLGHSTPGRSDRRVLSARP